MNLSFPWFHLNHFCVLCLVSVLIFVITPLASGKKDQYKDEERDHANQIFSASRNKKAQQARLKGSSNPNFREYHYFNGKRKVKVYLAMDELQVIHKHGQKSSLEDLRSFFSDSISDVIHKEGRTHIRFTRPHRNRTQLQASAQIFQNQGHVICPVFYRNPEGARGRRTSRSLSNRLCVKLRQGNSIQKLLNTHEVKIAKTVSLSPNTYVLECTSQDILASLDTANAIYESGECEFSMPLIRRWRYPRLIPADPLFEDQWHLKNNGQALDSVSGNDVKITTAWDMVSGAGITIAIVDDGLEYTHEDLVCNARTDIDIDLNFDDDDPFPDPSFDDHGTSVAGVVGACSNAVGGVGSAFNADLVGIRLIADSNDDEQEALGLSHHVAPMNPLDQIHISNNSWGPDDDGATLETFGPMAKMAFENAVENGRGGLGTIFVWSAGNGRCEDDNTNFDGYASSRYTIAVGASGGDGTFSYYSEPGASMLVNAPSSYGTCSGLSIAGITTTDLSGNNGSSVTNYANDFGGTSSAAPLVSGIVALMLEANPNLGWRDVQHILVETAEMNDPSDPDWKKNAAGKGFNPDYGFGRVKATGAVDQAMAWVNVPGYASPLSANESVIVPIPDNDLLGIHRSLTMNASSAFITEHVEVVVDITHESRGDLSIILESPSGTKSELASARILDTNEDFSNWQFTSVANWGENPNGTWKLMLVDNLAQFLGTLNHWSLKIHGFLDESLLFTPTDNFIINDSIDNNNGFIDPGETQISVFLEVQNNGENTSSDISAILSSMISTVTLISNASDYPDLQVNGSAMNETAFVFSVDPGHPCGATIDLKLTLDSSAGNHEIVFKLPSGKKRVSTSFAYDSFSGNDPVVSIPDNDPQGVTIPLEISGLATVNNVLFSIDGEQCNGLESASTNGINHPFIGDLVITLKSPGGSEIELMNRPGFNFSGRDGNNFCDTVFDDHFSESPIEFISGTQAPFSGSFAPEGELAAFIGENPNGMWMVNFSDRAEEDTGNIRGFTLTIEDSECEEPFDPPLTISQSQIVVTGDNGDGIFKIGETILVTWNNSSNGDNNDDVSMVTINFFGIPGQTEVMAQQSSDIWSAMYTLREEDLTADGLTVGVTAGDDLGNMVQVFDDDVFSIDTSPPIVIATNITVTGDGGDGNFRENDQISISWDNSAAGDDNGDIGSVFVDFFGIQGQTAIPATNLSNVWSATYTLQMSDLTDVNTNAGLVVFDIAGNQTSIIDDGNFIFGEPVDYSLNLTPGWNLISIPVQSISTVISLFNVPLLGNVWEWKLDQLRIVDGSSILRPKTGYWLYCQTTTSIPIPGTPIIDEEIFLLDGWNLIGPVASPPFEGKTAELDVVLSPADGISKPIWAWSKTRYKSSPHLEMGKGYWVFLKEQ